MTMSFVLTPVSSADIFNLFDTVAGVDECCAAVGAIL